MLHATIPVPALSVLGLHPLSEACLSDLSPAAAERSLRNLRAIAAANETAAVLNMYERACWHQGIEPDVTAEIILGAQS